MYKIKHLAILALFVSVFQFANAQIIRPKIVKKTTPPPVYVRYLPDPGCPRTIKAENGDSTVLIRNRYVEMSDSSLIRLRSRLERVSTVPFRYEITPDNSAGYYRINTFSKKLSAGIYANYLMHTAKTRDGSWIQEDFSTAFDGISYRLADFEVGVFAGRQLYAEGRNILSAELAAAYRGIIQSISINQYETAYSATDPDGDDYERSITVSDYLEKTFTHGIVIPIALRYDWFFHKKVSLFTTAGLKNSFLFSQKSNAQFNARYAGVYGDEFFNLTIDQNGIYDFGVFPDNSLELAPKYFHYDLYGSLSAGLQVFIGDIVSIEAAAMYLPRIASSKAAENERFVLSSSSDNFQSVTKVMKPEYASRWGVTLRVKANF